MHCVCVYAFTRVHTSHRPHHVRTLPHYDLTTFGMASKTTPVTKHTMKTIIIDLSAFTPHRISRPTFTEQALMSAVCFQQISIAVGRKLRERLMTLLADPFPLTVSALREVGFSERKAETILGISKFFTNLIGTKDFYQPGDNVSSDKLVDLFTQIKGVGPWTVKAYLLWQENRKDIALYEDLEVRKGMVEYYNLKHLPSVKEGAEIAKEWPKGEESEITRMCLELGKSVPRTRRTKKVTA